MYLKFTIFCHRSDRRKNASIPYTRMSSNQFGCVKRLCHHFNVKDTERHRLKCLWKNKIISLNNVKNYQKYIFSSHCGKYGTVEQIGVNGILFELRKNSTDFSENFQRYLNSILLCKDYIITC